jgi:hypothetical protein
MAKRRQSSPSARRPSAQEIAELQTQAQGSGASYGARSGVGYGSPNIQTGGFGAGDASGGNSYGGGAADGFSGSGSGGFGGTGVGRIPGIPNIDLPDAASVLSSGSAPAGALQSAMRMSDAVDGRVLPGASAFSGSAPSFGSGLPGRAPGLFAVPGRASSSASNLAGSFSSGGSPAGSFGGASGGVMGGDTYYFGGSGGPRISAAVGDAPGTNNIVASAQSSSNAATSTRWGDPAMAPAGRAPSLSGYPAGMGGGSSGSGGMGFPAWDFSGISGSSSSASGGSSNLSMPRTSLPSLPTALRFRYAGAPLWWSGGGASSGGGAGGSDDSGDDDSSDNVNRIGRPLRSALRAANSAATLWRSILVHPSGSDQGAQGGGASGSDAGGMDRSWDDNASSMSSLDTKLAILAVGAGGGAAAGAVAGKGAESVYIAMDNAGRAGTVSGSQSSSRLEKLQMSIVAAVPPAPPPLESMGSGSFGGTSAQAHYEPRAKKHGAANGGESGKKADEGTSHSKIEGSVDAIAQRIYHRIRRRIASDRERFGG